MKLSVRHPVTAVQRVLRPILPMSFGAKLFN